MSTRAFGTVLPAIAQGIKTVPARRLGILAALLLGSAGPALGFDLFGLKLFESQAEEDAEAVIGDPQPYTIDFSAPNADPAVESVVRDASDLWTDREQPASGTAGLVAKARGDYGRILNALYRQGYYGGVVTIRIGGREATLVAPDARLPDPVAVTVAVNPGPLFHFNRLAIANRAPATSDPVDQVDSPEDGGFVAGDVARSTAIVTAEQASIEAWRELGYPKAAIAKRDVIADHRNNTVDVTITVAPDGHAAIGPVSVSGTTNMDPAFVARQTGLVLGEEYDPDTIEAARKRLSRLEVFRSLQLEPADSIGRDGLLPYQVVVQEYPLHRFGVGATYSTVDGLGVQGFWLNRNLFGQAERLRLDAKIASIGYPIDTEQFDYAFGGTFTKPGIFNPDTDLVASVSAERTVLDTFTETSASARVGVNYLLSDQITLNGSAFLEQARFDDRYGIRDFTTAGVTGDATFDNRDDMTDPTGGFYLNANVEPFYEFSYGNLGVRGTVEGRTYWSLDADDKYVLAARAKAGAILGPSLEETPPDRLFFAGGGGSVRGYAYKSIGVENDDGTVSGGRYLLEGSAEVRAKVTDSIGIVAFADAGYVGADTFPDLDQLKVGAGVGVRYYTGFGPLRADIAFPLNKRDGDADYAVYLGLGQSF